MKSPSVALYPAALILWITSSEKGSAGRAGELCHLLSAILPRLQEEKPLKLKKKVTVAEQSLWGALSSGKDSLVWNSLGLLISRACYKKHSSAHTGDDRDIHRKRRICANSVTSEGRLWSPAVSVDSKLPGFFLLFFNNLYWRNTCVHLNKMIYRRRWVVIIVPGFPPAILLCCKLLFSCYLLALCNRLIFPLRRYICSLANFCSHNTFSSALAFRH